jgi:hypothetical protein
MLKFLTQTLPGIKYFTFWIFLFGLLIYSFGYFKILELSYDWIYDFAKTGGSIFMSSAVFMGIVKSYQFTGIFKEELRKVVFGEDHLSKRTDIDDIWENLTLQLCKQKFKKISNKLQKIVKQYYLPIEDEFYFKNTKLVVEIEHNPDNAGYINVVEEFKTTIIIEDSEKIDYIYTSSIPFPNEDTTITYFELSEFTLNESNIIWEKGKELKESSTNNILSNKFNIKLECVKGKKEYIVYRKTKKCYALSENPYMGHTASGLYENYDFHLTYPKNMSFDWLGMGVLGKWKITRSENTVCKTLKANYNGLMFKNQGFLLLFK